MADIRANRLHEVCTQLCQRDARLKVRLYHQDKFETLSVNTEKKNILMSSKGLVLASFKNTYTTGVHVNKLSHTPA